METISINANWLTVLLGVPSGIVAAMLVWLFVTFWDSAFTPWVRTLLYRGIKLSGEWSRVVIEDSNGANVTEIENAYQTISYVLNIEKQHGHKVKGTFSQSVKANGTETQGRYSFEGEIVDAVIMVVLSPINKGKSTFGTLLMNTAAAGNKLEGKFTYKSSRSNKITAVDLTLDKNP